MCQVSSTPPSPLPPSPRHTDKVQTRLAIWEVYIRSSCSLPPLRRKCSVFYPEKVWQAGVFNNITARHSIFSRVPFTLLSNRKSVAIFSTHDIPYTSSSIPWWREHLNLLWGTFQGRSIGSAPCWQQRGSAELIPNLLFVSWVLWFLNLQLVFQDSTNCSQFKTPQTLIVEEW